MVWGVYSSTHCDTDANVHTDIHANAYANIYVDADAVPQCLSAAYHEVEGRLTMRFLSIAILLSVALLVTATFPPVAVGQTP